MDFALKEIEEFFHEVSPAILDLVRKNRNRTDITTQKVNTEDSVDFATETDVAVELLITSAIRKQFPHDAILAEEESSHTKLDGAGRLWIIDPICGTSNFAVGLPLYVSNIALAEHGIIIASCVVDHLFGKYYWSVGEGIYENRKPANIEKKGRGTKIDVDLGALISAPQGAKDRHAKFVARFIRETDITCVTLNTSQTFLYVVLGMYEGFVTPWIHAWDISASAFLIQQSGGIITDIDGNPWKISSTNAVAARELKLHTTLLKYLRND